MTRKRFPKLVGRVGACLLFLGAAGTFATNCSVYDTSLLQQGTTDASQDTPASCQLARVPPPPEGKDLGGGEPFVVAFSLFDFGDEAGPDGGRNQQRDLGFDLDNECSTEKRAACQRPSWANGDIGDGPGGIDNSLAKVIQRVQDTVPRFGSVSYTDAIEAGLTTVINRISDYNGQADDDFIQVEVFVPAPMNSFPSAERTKPQWDGNDVWPISSDSVENDDINQPKFVSTIGYVSNYQIVANLDLALMRITTALTETALSKLEINFIKPFVVARISKDESGQYMLTDGVIAGRWPVAHFIGQLGQFPDPYVLGQEGRVVPLCPPGVYHETFRDQICELVDVIADPTNTQVPECDAISVGIGFEARAAKIGDVFRVNDLVRPCSPNLDPGLEQFFCGRPILRTDAGVDAGGGRGGRGGTGGSSGRGGSAGRGGSSGSGGSGGATGGAGGMDATADSAGDSSGD